MLGRRPDKILSCALLMMPARHMHTLLRIDSSCSASTAPSSFETRASTMLGDDPGSKLIRIMVVIYEIGMD